MAKLVGVMNCSHVWIGRPPELWDAIRQARQLRDDVPTDTFEERVEKAERIAVAVKKMKDKLAELRPDVIIAFGGDQNENFPAPELRVYPQISVFVGDEFSGIRYDAEPGDPQQVLQNHSGLSKAIVYGLMDNEFDPAYCMDVPNAQKGIGHAIMNPLGYFTDYKIPVVPIILNAIYAPCLTGKRANQLGNAVRRIIDEYPEDLRVVAMSSGGLWHTPGEPQAWLNEEFDEVSMKYLAAGDTTGWAHHIDSYVPDPDDQSQWVGTRNAGASGMPATPGPQGGTREEIDWVAASSTAEGSPFDIVDMIQIYSSPINCTFAMCYDVK